MISENLETTLHLGFVEARKRRHEVVTVDHLICWILDNKECIAAIEACGGDVNGLRQSITRIIDDIPAAQGVEEVDPQPNLGFQRVIQRAIMHVSAAGKDKLVTGANCLVAAYGETDFPALQILQMAGVNRIDVVNYIAHGTTITKRSPQSGEEIIAA